MIKKNRVIRVEIRIRLTPKLSVIRGYLVCCHVSVTGARYLFCDVLGPTTAVHLLHSQATISSRVYESYDQRYHHTWEVTKTGDGLISVGEPPADEQPTTVAKPVDLHIDRDVVERLLNAYFTEIAPIFPVVTQAEFLASPSPPPMLLYSMCLVAAARRDVPQSVFDSIRYAVNTVIRAEDVLSTATIVNVQALLILCMVGDCHSQFVPNALSALWVRLGTAIRMVSILFFTTGWYAQCYISPH